MTLHERISKALGWSIGEVQSMSLHSLREMVRTSHPKLAAEISLVIADGRHIKENAS